MQAIYKRELQSYFHSMIGYIFIAFLLAITGVYFMAFNLTYGYPTFSYVLESLVFLLLIAVPVLTMRSFAEDRKNKTDQLLLTAPVSVSKIVLGKYLALVTVYLIPHLFFCFFPLLIKMQGTAYLLKDYSALLAFFLLGCVFIAIGLLLSALTESSIIAAITTFGVLLLLYLLEGIVQFIPATSTVNLVGFLLLFSLLVYGIYHMTKNKFLAAVIELILLAVSIVAYMIKPEWWESLLSKLCSKFYLMEPLTNIVENDLFDISGLILYFSLIGIFLFLTVQSIQKRRWS